LSHRYLPNDRKRLKAERPGFDHLGTLLLALTLAAYALAMTTGRGSFGPFNVALLLASVFGAGLFLLAEKRTASPLIHLAMFRNLALTSSLATSMLVSTVMMATLVVGPFYLSRTLGLDAAHVGLVLSVGPLVAALTAVPAGRMADRFGPPRMITMGLLGMTAGAFTLSMLPTILGIPGYVAPIVVITASYALFPDRQQHQRHDGCQPGPARSHFRHAQLVTQPGTDYRGFSHGRCVRPRIGDDRPNNGTPRGRCQRYAHDVLGRGGASCRRARDRGWSVPSHFARSEACSGRRTSPRVHKTQAIVNCRAVRPLCSQQVAKAFASVMWQVWVLSGQSPVACMTRQACCSWQKMPR
jgi:hypothetical protein